MFVEPYHELFYKETHFLLSKLFKFHSVRCVCECESHGNAQVRHEVAAVQHFVATNSAEVAGVLQAHFSQSNAIHLPFRVFARLLLFHHIKYGNTRIGLPFKHVKSIY